MKKYITLFILLFFCFGFSSPQTGIIARKNAGGGVVNGVIGNGVQNAAAGGAADRIYHSNDVPSVAGTVQWGHVYLNDGNGYTFYIYLYASDGTQLAYCTVVGTDATPGWYECQAASPYVVVAATTYYYGAGNPSGAADLYKVASGHSGVWYDSQAVDADTTLNPEETLTDADGNISVIWNNTSGTP